MGDDKLMIFLKPHPLVNVYRNLHFYKEFLAGQLNLQLAEVQLLEIELKDGKSCEGNQTGEMNICTEAPHTPFTAGYWRLACGSPDAAHEGGLKKAFCVKETPVDLVLSPRTSESSAV